MDNTLPIEHLSPTQLSAYTSLASGKAVEVCSTDINGLIEILNLLVNAKDLTLLCNSHTFRLLQDYKERHSQPIEEAELGQLLDQYHKSINQLTAAYHKSYPTDAASIRHQYFAILNAYGKSIHHNIDLQDRLRGQSLDMLNTSMDIAQLLFSYKRTWSQYDLIDPMQSHYYTATIDASQLRPLDIWITTVQHILDDMHQGLNEIVNEEKQRIQGIKKELSQHLVNYQHSQSESELSQMRQKIGFLMADLPKDVKTGFADQVMYAVSNWETVTSKYLSRHSRRFNSRNHQSLLLYEAMQELRAVLRAIDENGFIKVDISNNPLSYETQIVQVENLLSQLLFCKYWISDEPDYIEWKRFYAAISSEEKSIVDVLITIDKSDLQNQLNYMQIQQWKDNVIQLGVPIPNDALAVFEAFKELNASIDWSTVKLMSSTSNTGDYTITFDSKHYILTTTAEANNRKRYILEDKSLHDIKPMVTLDYYSQSNQANQLAKAIIASEANIRTFQTKALNIISCLDEIDTDQVLRLLAHTKINELKGESISDLIKGSILNEGKEKLMLIYDDLLNVQQVSHFIWQRLVIQSMSSAGYKVISINTKDTLNHIDLAHHLTTYLPLEARNSINYIS